MDDHDQIKTESPAGPAIEPSPPLASDVETPTIALVGFLGAIVIVAILFALQVVYYRAAAAQYRIKDVDPPIVELQQALTAQQAKLTQYRWIDQAKGVAAIPIDRAMEIVVREMASGSAPNPPATAHSAGGKGNAKP